MLPPSPLSSPPTHWISDEPFNNADLAAAFFGDIKAVKPGGKILCKGGCGNYRITSLSLRADILHSPTTFSHSTGWRMRTCTLTIKVESRLWLDRWMLLIQNVMRVLLQERFALIYHCCTVHFIWELFFLRRCSAGLNGSSWRTVLSPL